MYILADSEITKNSISKDEIYTGSFFCRKRILFTTRQIKKFICKLVGASLIISYISMQTSYKLQLKEIRV